MEKDDILIYNKISANFSGFSKHKAVDYILTASNL